MDFCPKMEPRHPVSILAPIVSTLKNSHPLLACSFTISSRYAAASPHWKSYCFNIYSGGTLIIFYSMSSMPSSFIFSNLVFFCLREIFSTLQIKQELNVHFHSGNESQ